ncbi:MULTISPECIES: MotA/TolQ/ExbB proton channel family protein [Comamonas]|mgnify:FL=1|uniref:Biopolymer transport protein ExbB n=1 Tax=Comamonas thiooxydans TaxID=363952 RepID=A0AA42PWJ5_9BURK|nr:MULTISPECIES: MotA/TolQ/ExbB proton channel family protein [Comamonas]BCX55152.1 flagellar motor protein MotA [Comamonas testosteroni]KKI15745.1 flagellar motor protein MotA [Comamonas thiooxydans]MBL5977991.1 MotA/TolQ/ExbB proton channel family protein [Comamonas sp. NyZ500]MDH1252224.1 MotA/TolQ/ExbB proton channel family protein [Comamonas thiooxydans]MDH1332932.1 MotA/TolQ/ExbB proton channel family protein [Comamonas thiooxydans]
MSAGMWQWLAEGDAVTWATAALMLLMSVLSWVVILYKLWFMAVARRRVPQAVAAFWQMPDLVQAMAQVKALDRQGLVQAMADAVAQGGAAAQGSLAQSAAQGQRLLRSLREALGQASTQLQWGQTLLATIGATAPFVGLLGTVWGIHHALGTLAGSGQVDIAQLAGPVGEALVMTAAGLAVALPAVLAYNLLGRSASQLEAVLEGFAHDLHAQFGVDAS